MDDGVIGGATYTGSKEAGVVVGVRSWESHQLIWGGDTSAIPANIDLLTGGIELGFSFLVRQVEGDDLVSDEILSWSEIIWKSSVVDGPGHFIRA